MSENEKGPGWTDSGRAGAVTTGATATGVPGPRARPARSGADGQPTENVTALLADEPANVTEQLTAPVHGPVPGPVTGRPAPRTAVPTGAGAGPGDGRPQPRMPRMPRMPRQAPTTRIGPWGPLAGAVAGLVAGVVAALLLRGSATTYDERLSLVFVVLGLTLLGAGTALLADEVRLLRRGAQAVEARTPDAGPIAGLLNGLTPARLLVLASAFVLLLSAYVTQRG